MITHPSNLKELINYSKGGIISKVLVKEPKLNITLFCMAADTEIGKHTSTKEAFIHVLEGNGVFNLEGKEILMEAGKLIRMNKNALHSLKAEKDTSFLLYLF